MTRWEARPSRRRLERNAGTLRINLDGLSGVCGRLALMSAVVVVLYGTLGPTW
jgi:hypothetical protein